MKHPYSYVPEYLPNMLPPMKPGVYPDLPAEIYHRIFAASKSVLWEMEERSPAHALASLLHPCEPTPAMRLGTMAHAAILEPAAFANTYTAALQCSAQTQAKKQCSKAGSVRVGGAWYCGTHAPVGQPDAVEVITPDQLERVEGMKTAILSGEYTGPLLWGPAGQSEVSIFWQDVDTGIPCKARLDRVLWESGLIADVKTTTSAHPADFDRIVVSKGYYAQAAHYLHGLAAVGKPATAFLLLPVECEPPHGIGVVEVAEGALDEGRRVIERALQTWRVCVETGKWPGYEPAPRRFVDVPKWALDTKELVLA